MFCLDPLHPLYNTVIEVVGAKPGITVADLHKELTKLHKLDVSLQHLYRTVNRLIEEQVLIKTKSALSLNLMWLSYIAFFADKGRSKLLEQREMGGVQLKEGQRKQFDLDTLADVQTLWNHLLVQLHREAPQKYLFKYYSHVWWQLGRHALNPDFYKAIRERGVNCEWLYGNDTFLDRETLKRHGELFDWRIAKDPPFPKEGYNINIYGDCILECIFPERIAKHLALLFQSVKSLDEFDEGILDDIFAMKAKYKVTLWRSKAQASLLRAKITQFFLKH